MTASTVKQPSPPQKIVAAAIAPPPTRRYRAAAFQAYVLVAAVLFVLLAVAARAFPYFPIDLKVTRVLQGYHGAAFDWLMHALSWLGFPPQVYLLAAMAVLLLYFAGLRWEAVAALFAACGSAFGLLVKLVVHRPRPSADLIHVLEMLSTPGFPSGHVLGFTTLGGFLAFLGYTMLKSSWSRTVLLVVLALLIVLIGPSRVYLGQHWSSDVVGAYLLGSLWLALTIMLYRWGKTRYFTSQPVAPEAPATSAVARKP